MNKCLVYLMNGYHVYCDWHKQKCEHNVGRDTKFVNHCKFCLTGMAETFKEKWVEEDNTPMKNPFL